MEEELMSIEVHFEKHIVNHNVIREADAKGHREYIIVTALAAMFLFGLFADGWQHYQWIQYGYRIQEAQKKKEQLTEISQQLRLERASLRSVQRIDAIARRELGMVVPARGQIVMLHAGAPLTIPTQQVQQARVEPPLQTQPAALELKR